VRNLKFHNKHKGERCFVIGNGPSLRASDLERLKNEICFAANKIYLMYEKTAWRPTYYATGDFIILNEHEVINEKVKCDKFFYINSALTHKGFCPTDSANTYYFSVDQSFWHRPFPYKIEFRAEPDVFGEGMTITYICLQLAAYMGFDRIYLLGVDHCFPMSVKSDGERVWNGVDAHFAANYSTRNDFFPAYIDYATAAYKTAKDYSETHGFKICNATRGGALEVFERVDFDSLF
jgi:hypothetical protein